jgi:hypothetical protein
VPSSGSSQAELSANILVQLALQKMVTFAHFYAAATASDTRAYDAIPSRRSKTPLVPIRFSFWHSARVSH